MAQKASPRATLGCTGLIVVAIVIAIVVGAASHKGSGSTDLWGYERQQLASDLNSLDVAERAGNAPHAAQIRESLLKHCQTDAALAPDTSSDHAAVQSLCGTLGFAVP